MTPNPTVVRDCAKRAAPHFHVERLLFPWPTGGSWPVANIRLGMHSGCSRCKTVITDLKRSKVH